MLYHLFLLYDNCCIKNNARSILCSYLPFMISVWCPFIDTFGSILPQSWSCSLAQVAQVSESECLSFACRNNHAFPYLMFKTLHHYNACEIEITFRSKTFTIMSNALHLLININAKYTYKCTCPIQIQLKSLHEVKDFLTNYFLVFIFTDSDFLGVFWALRSGCEIGSYSKVCTCDLFSCWNIK